ncbi:hypothetical protein N8J89_34840 [Crossiella sp. CA-258035]|uniref:hypothetical protein n=1 Tax=Crossiella sp. CA-258035 TaxID=2981138 RepID=UPI0024BD19CD|nr:hypothetical protein [Crossiella sp. CA-258035]WHT18237.1 hypothetical protein N8J89_34840 [Crossiella sp. CA-258035]
MSRLVSRPRPLTIASVLWIVLGVVLALAGLYQYGSPRFAGNPISLVMAVVGVLILVFGLLLRGGAGWTRIPLTVLGAIMCVGLWPLLVVAPAILLQFGRASQDWLSLPPQPHG